MSQYLDYNGLSLYDRQIKAYINAMSGGDSGVRVIFLDSTPTSSTISYTIEGVLYPFRIGDEVRVPDGNDGYFYYKLYSLTTSGNVTTAKWGKLNEIPNEIVSDTSGSFTLAPNTFYSFGEMSSMTISLATPINNIVNTYMFEFDSGSTATDLTLPSGIYWNNTPSIVASKHYEISIKYNLNTSSYYGIISTWSLS